MRGGWGVGKEGDPWPCALVPERDGMFQATRSRRWPGRSAWARTRARSPAQQAARRTERSFGRLCCDSCMALCPNPSSDVLFFSPFVKLVSGDDLARGPVCTIARRVRWCREETPGGAPEPCSRWFSGWTRGRGGVRLGSGRERARPALTGGHGLFFGGRGSVVRSYVRHLNGMRGGFFRLTLPFPSFQIDGHPPPATRSADPHNPAAAGQPAYPWRWAHHLRSRPGAPGFARRNGCCGGARSRPFFRDGERGALHKN